MTYVKCSRSNCFGNFCGTNCRILSKPIVGKACPFFKTVEQNELSKMEAFDRLERTGMKVMLAKYADCRE